MAKPRLTASGTPIPATPLPVGDPRLIPTIDRPGREELHERAITRALERGEPVPADARPFLCLMGGGSASGKTSILGEMIDAGVIPCDGVLLVDADECKKAIPEFHELIALGDSRAAEVVHAESSAMAQKLIARAFAQRMNIIYDSTLSDAPRVEGLITRARGLGYEIRLIGVTAHPPEAWRRAVERGKDSGRFVPLGPLLKAHKRFAQLFERYALLADTAVLWKTDCKNLGAEKDAELIAEKRDGKLMVLFEAGYRQFQESATLNENANAVEEIFPG